MGKLKRKLYGEELPVVVNVGDRVKAAVYPKTVIGTVTKIVGAAIFIDSKDSAGMALCVHANAVKRLPGLNDVGYAVTVAVH